MYNGNHRKWWHKILGHSCTHEIVVLRVWHRYASVSIPFMASIASLNTQTGLNANSAPLFPLRMHGSRVKISPILEEYLPKLAVFKLK